MNNPAAKKQGGYPCSGLQSANRRSEIEQVDTFLAHLGGTRRSPGATSEPPTKEHADKFFAKRFGAVLAKAFGLEPVGRLEVIGVEVACSYVQTLAAHLTPSDGD